MQPPFGGKNAHDRGCRARTTTAYRHLAHDMLFLGSVPRHAAVSADHARRRRKQAPTTPRTSWMERCCTRTAVPVKATAAHTASPMSEPSWTRKADQKPRDRYGRCTLVHSPPYRAPRLLPANHEGQWAMPVSTRAGRVHHVVMMVRWNVQ